MKDCRKDSSGNFRLTVSGANGICPIGEEVGNRNINNGSTPVLSCEGACIRGEIARQAANYLSKEGNFRRGCHGELFAVPGSRIAEWIRGSGKVVCIDGCFLKCHSRIIENIIDPSRLLSFDALSFHKKYNDIFDIDDVPEQERKEVAGSVAQWVKESVEKDIIPVNIGGCCT